MRRAEFFGTIPVGLSVLAAILIGCGGGGGGGSTGGGPTTGTSTAGGTTGGTISPAARIAAITAVEEKAKEIGNTGTRASQNAALAAYMASRPEFEASGVDLTECAWGRFKDGRILIVANNRTPQPTPAAIATSTITRAPSNLDLPNTTQARLLHSFGLGFDAGQSVISDLSTWLKANGYTMAGGAEGDARVNTLKQVSGDGFFYFNTHGGRGRNRNGHDLFAMQSSTLVSDAIEGLPEFQQDLDSSALVYMTARNGEKILGGLVDDWDTRYAITANFVEKYMSFGKNSLLYFNVCYSGNTANQEAAGGFIFACQKKGAGVVMGWTKTISSNTGFHAVRFLTDRLLGANVFEPETPKQRPFDWKSVLEQMKAKGIAAEPWGSELAAYPSPANDPILGSLAPSIMNMFVVEGQDTLVIGGAFGADPGTDRLVTVGGTPVTVKTWEPGTITCTIPASGAGSSGDVVVRSKNRRSNTVQLSDWRMPVLYRWVDVGSLQRQIAFDLHFRADLHALRLKPGETPKPWSFGPLPLAAAKDSTATSSATGTAFATSGGSRWDVTWTGGAPLAYSFTSVDDGNSFLCFGSVDPALKQIKLTLRGRADHVMTTVFTDAEGHKTTQSQTITYDTAFGGAEFQVPVLTLDSQFRIVGGAVTKTTDSHGGAAATSGATATVRWTWPLTPASSPPDATSARSRGRR
ncbi:MAG: hypothetical protein QOJ65_2250 [Fimbriimonadaceae bacterium]|jgi:hypothetical protein|nr:hypothetical protein [Fimbriimonadaceae bacterium]